WYYLLVPIILFIALHFGANARRLFFLVTIVMVLAPLTFRLNSGDWTDRHQDVENAVVFRLDAIGWGMLAAYCRVLTSSWMFEFRKVFFVLGVVLISACFLCVSHPKLHEMSAGAAILPTIISVGFALMLPTALENGTWNSPK